MNRAKYLEFFRRELTDNLLYFWMDRCLDTENGGYFNCFTNDGRCLVSTDKYIWSQGRFLWMFSKLAMLESSMFDETQRERFLQYAKSGRDFLLRHVLLAPDDYRCVFLTDAAGNPKEMPGQKGYDLSISADCFVVMGFAAYAKAAKDADAWAFCKKLGDSVWERYHNGNYRAHPYPVPAHCASHARPMILTNMCCEMFKAAEMLDTAYCDIAKERIRKCHRDTFATFADENGLVHEFVTDQEALIDSLFFHHINPGHTLEDMWFQWEAADLLGEDAHRESIVRIVKNTMELGWDEAFGGLYHFIACDGLHTEYTAGAMAEEAQMKLVLDDWGSKLWWVHSEAMYTTLLMYIRTGQAEFKELFEKVFTYTYQTFPNPDREIREWIQIRTREGKPQEKVVALPVKDPYHIVRNVMLCIELLEGAI